MWKRTPPDTFYLELKTRTSEEVIYIRNRSVCLGSNLTILERLAFIAAILTAAIHYFVFHQQPLTQNALLIWFTVLAALGWLSAYASPQLGMNSFVIRFAEQSLIVHYRFWGIRWSRTWTPDAVRYITCRLENKPMKMGPLLLIDANYRQGGYGCLTLHPAKQSALILQQDDRQELLWQMAQDIAKALNRPLYTDEHA